MLTGEIRNQVDRIWDTFWTGGISNPLEVIEQLTYLLFIKRLDEVHTLRESKANRKTWRSLFAAWWGWIGVRPKNALPNF